MAGAGRDTTCHRLPVGLGNLVRAPCDHASRRSHVCLAITPASGLESTLAPWARKSPRRHRAHPGAVYRLLAIGYWLSGAGLCWGLALGDLRHAGPMLRECHDGQRRLCGDRNGSILPANHGRACDTQIPRRRRLGADAFAMRAVFGGGHRRVGVDSGNRAGRGAIGRTVSMAYLRLMALTRGRLTSSRVAMSDVLRDQSTDCHWIPLLPTVCGANLRRAYDTAPGRAATALSISRFGRDQSTAAHPILRLLIVSGANRDRRYLTACRDTRRLRAISALRSDQSTAAHFLWADLMCQIPTIPCASRIFFAACIAQ